MTLSHFRSATNLRSRPIGPRSPKPVLSSDLPSDLSNGRLEDLSPAYTPPNSSSSSPRPGSPNDGRRISSVLLDSDAQRPWSGTTLVAQIPERILVSTSIQTDSVNNTSDTPPILPSRSPPPVVKKISKPPTLATPPAVKFDSEPVRWRGMTLEVAQWTFNSQELQEIVSAAIRKSAHESFIRLVSTKVLEEELSAELQQLDTVRVDS